MNDLIWRIPALLVSVVNLVLYCIALLFLVALAVILAYDPAALTDKYLRKKFEKVKDRVINSLLYLVLFTALVGLSVCLSVILMTSTKRQTETHKAFWLSRIWTIVNCILLTFETLRVAFVFYLTEKFDLVTSAGMVIGILFTMIVQGYKNELVRTRRRVRFQ